MSYGLHQCEHHVCNYKDENGTLTHFIDGEVYEGYGKYLCKKHFDLLDEQMQTWKERIKNVL